MGSGAFFGLGLILGYYPLLVFRRSHFSIQGDGREVGGRWQGCAIRESLPDQTTHFLFHKTIPPNFQPSEMGVNWDEEGVLPRSCRNLEVYCVAVSVESGLVDSFGKCWVSVNSGVDIINRSFK